MKGVLPYRFTLKPQSYALMCRRETLIIFTISVASETRWDAAKTMSGATGNNIETVRI